MPRRVTAVKTRTAHLVGPGKIKLINARLAYSSKEQGPLRLDVDALKRVYCYGDVGVTDRALRLLFQRTIQVSWHSLTGLTCYGYLARADGSSAALRMLQHQALSCPEQACELACHFVKSKIGSQIDAARHFQRHGWLEVGNALALLRRAQHNAGEARDLDQLRGVEGNASQIWFSILGQVLPAPWVFTKRQRRPPPDPINALLSLGYTWLLGRVRDRLDAAGLEIYLGALHPFRPGRPSLACDLMEPLRAPSVDRWLVGLCRRQHVTPQHFNLQPQACRLQPAVFPQILASWEEHFQKSGGEDLLEDSLDELLAWLRRRQPAIIENVATEGEIQSPGQSDKARQ